MADRDRNDVPGEQDDLEESGMEVSVPSLHASEENDVQLEH